MSEIVKEAQRRRTFAIISHPDAGKTTLTEKFLLYSGAVSSAGAVKARSGRRSARSDWMALEQQRGISVSSTVLQFEYRNMVCNLLDTPGHRDFSEDTYRVLTAADAAIMVLDAAKGVESQTLKLFEVAHQRGIPLLTFVNKFDRPGLDALELLDHVEREIGVRPTPITWPVGFAGDFRGVVDRRSGQYTRFGRSARGASEASELELDAEQAAEQEGLAWTTAQDEMQLLSEVGADHSDRGFEVGATTPMFFGSALTNFGVRSLLDAVIDLAPPPSSREDEDDNEHPLESACSGFVFKVQANMDPSHRDRIAFVRICSGKFERGMTLRHARTDKPFATKYAHQLFAAERETVEIAFPGDVVGLVNASDLRVGDTLYAEERVVFPALPTFLPEHFVRARAADTSRFKQFRRGIAQLDEEGVVQLLQSKSGKEPSPVLGAVGPLQFDIASYRLEHEYGSAPRFEPYPFGHAHHTDAAGAEALLGRRGVEVFERTDGAYLVLFDGDYAVRLARRDLPDVELISGVTIT